MVGNFLKGFSPGQGKSTLSPQTVKQIRCLSAFYNVGERSGPLSRQIQYVEDKKIKPNYKQDHKFHIVNNIVARQKTYNVKFP